MSVTLWNFHYKSSKTFTENENDDKPTKIGHREKKKINREICGPYRLY